MLFEGILSVLCPECVENGLKSKVYLLGGYTTDVYCAPFYDEEGTYHFHLRNRFLRCSNGHEWPEFVHNRCPSCDWEYVGLSSRNT